MRRAVRVRTEGDVERLLQASQGRPVLVLKHSRTCPVSAMAWDAWRDFLRDPAAAAVQPAYLVVQDDRPASDALARRLGVRHESPQAILILGGRAVWHASHGAITAGELARAVTSRIGGEGGD